MAVTIKYWYVQLELQSLWRSNNPFSCEKIQWSEINLKRWIEPLSVKETLNNNLEWSLSDIFCSNVNHVSKYFVSSIRKVEPPKQAYRCIKNYLLYLKEKISRSNSCQTYVIALCLYFQLFNFFSREIDHFP